MLGFMETKNEPFVRYILKLNAFSYSAALSDTVSSILISARTVYEVGNYQVSLSFADGGSGFMKEGLPNRGRTHCQYVTYIIKMETKPNTTELAT